MLRSELLREAVDWEKTHPAERYYELDFPVFKADECKEFRALSEEMSKDLVGLFERQRQKMERAFRKTGLSEQGWELTEVTPCLFTNMYRGARTGLEEQGLIASREKHKNGARWIFWAEEVQTNGRKK